MSPKRYFLALYAITETKILELIYTTKTDECPRFFHTGFTGGGRGVIDFLFNVE